MPEATACLPSVVADTIMRTIELGVTITDAAVDEKQTTILCTPVTRDPRCPDCGADGRYRDTVTRPLTDHRLPGTRWSCRSAYPATAASPSTAVARCSIRTWACLRSRERHNTPLCSIRVAAVDDRPNHHLGHRCRTHSELRRASLSGCVGCKTVHAGQTGDPVFRDPASWGCQHANGRAGRSARD